MFEVISFGQTKASDELHLRSSACKNSLKYWLISDGVMLSLFSGFISWSIVVPPCGWGVFVRYFRFLLVGFRVLLCFQSAFRMKRLGGVYNYAKGLYDSSPTMSVVRIMRCPTCAGPDCGPRQVGQMNVGSPCEYARGSPALEFREEFRT